VRIVIDARILGTSTGRYVERLLHHLQDIDTVNRYVVLLLPGDLDRWTPRAPNFAKGVAAAPFSGFAEQFRFDRQLRTLRADVVHFTAPQHPLAYRRPHVVTVHDLTLVDHVNRHHRGVLKSFYAHDLKRLVFRGVIRWTARRSEAVITPTRYVRDQLISRFGADGARVHVTYEAAEPLAATPVPARYGQENDYLLTVGNAFPYKNLWRVIQAFGQLGRPGLSLVMVGRRDVFARRLERRTLDAGIDGVIFAGHVPDAELAWLYEHARMLVFPSLSEGFGLPPLEAMRYGLPVLSSDASCLPEVLGDGAQYFDPMDTGALASAIETLLDDPDRLERLREAGSRVVDRYSWRTLAERTLEIYERVGRRGSRSPASA
jgi:glycosyltransferase involved in cell wall biosynthesis